jgi:predicted transcriptional regulator
MSAERAKMFMEQTHAHATIMCGMLDRLKESGLLEEVVDTAAQPA